MFKATSLLSSLVAVGACRRSNEPARQGTLLARPVATITAWAPGIRSLGLGARDVALYLPPIRTNKPIPLIVLFHGAGGDGDRFLRRLLRIAGTERLAIMAPSSQGPTWDAVLPEQDTLIDVVMGESRLGRFGADVAFLDKALARVFEVVLLIARALRSADSPMGPPMHCHSGCSTAICSSVSSLFRRD